MFTTFVNGCCCVRALTLTDSLVPTCWKVTPGSFVMFEVLDASKQVYNFGDMMTGERALRW